MLTNAQNYFKRRRKNKFFFKMATQPDTESNSQADTESFDSDAFDSESSESSESTENTILEFDEDEDEDQYATYVEFEDDFYVEMDCCCCPDCPKKVNLDIKK